MQQSTAKEAIPDMPRPIWFEIPADDPKRAIQFYHDAFGWKITKLEWEMPYWIIDTPTGAGTAIGGAIMPREAGACTRNTINVPSLDEFFEKINDAGGKAVTDKMPIPGGTFAVCSDTEGNQFGLMEPNMDEMPPRAAPQGDGRLSVVHFEIPADDPQRAIAFYQTVFGWEVTKFEGPWEYWMVRTGSPDEPGMDGAIHPRGAVRCTADTIKVGDIDEFILRVNDSGGKTITEKQHYEGVGFVAGCEDSEGNIFGLVQTE